MMGYSQYRCTDCSVRRATAFHKSEGLFIRVFLLLTMAVYRDPMASQRIGANAGTNGCNPMTLIAPFETLDIPSVALSNFRA